jgi:cytochrome P450
VATRASSSLRNGENELVASYVQPIAAEVWSRLVTGGPDHAPVLAQCTQPIAKLMAFETGPTDVEKADQGSAALMDWARRHVGADLQGLVAALSFDAIDGAAGIASNALWLLATRPDLWAKLTGSATLVLPFLMEAERLHPPILGLERSSQTPLKVDGHEIPAGTNVLLLNCVANRDPMVFDAPGDVDLNKPQPKALSFGLGPRSCAGRMLARLVSEAALRALLRRCDRVEIAEPVDWGPPGQLRTARALVCDISLRNT